MKKEKFAAILFLCIFCFSACSSAPQKKPDISTDRDMSLKLLNLANQAGNRGRYEEALNLLREARRLAVSADDPVLRLKTSISKGDFFFSMGEDEAAFAEWESAAAEAKAEADTSKEPDFQVLSALARIHSIRAKILLLDTDPRAANVEELKNQLIREMTAVKSDDNATADGNVTLGLVERQMGSWTEAESAIKKAVSYHEGGLFLEEAAYDWFLIASIRSMAGNYNTSLDALEKAISLDRRAENGFGLASSWQAKGDVLKKAGRDGEARTAWNRAAEIYRAIGLNNLAENVEGKYQ